MCAINYNIHWTKLCSLNIIPYASSSKLDRWNVDKLTHITLFLLSSELSWVWIGIQPLCGYWVKLQFQFANVKIDIGEGGNKLETVFQECDYATSTETFLPGTDILSITGFHCLASNEIAPCFCVVGLMFFDRCSNFWVTLWVVR